ncbi:MAG: FAD-dependent oxidoreductase [Thermoleophilia bacterium]
MNPAARETAARATPSRFDAIIVGGGPAGLAAAITIAEAGLKVAVIERGDWPGSKNVMGGLIYSHPTSQIVPDFWKEAPLERHVVRRDMWMTTADSTLKASYETTDFALEPYNSFTVFRSRFDKWLAEQARARGAYIINETLVEDLLLESGKVIGVRTGRPGGDLEGNVVILAEGVNRFLTEKAGLGAKIRPATVALAVKEVLSLPKDRIEDRFNLEDGTGAALEIVGDVTGGLPGTGFIYTNRDTISIGVGVILKGLVDKVGESYELLERFKRQPQVKRLIDGAKPREYAAHLIPEGGYRDMPQLYGDGVLVAGDAAGMVNAVFTEGANLALLSGRAAGETVIRAGKTGNFSAHTLSWYGERLEKSLVIKDLKQFEDAAPFLSSHAHMFNLYPEVASAAMKELLTVDSLSKADKTRLIMRLFRSQVPTRRLVRDAYDAWRAIL